MDRNRANSVLITGVLAVLAIFAACVFILLALDSMPATALVLGWAVAATLPFVMRGVNMRLLLRQPLSHPH